MSFSTFKVCIRLSFPHVPLIHWVVIVVLSLVFSFLMRKKYSAYASIVLGLTLFLCLFLFDAFVLIRFRSVYPFDLGCDFVGEFNRLIHGDEIDRALMLFNIAAFFPFGFFLSEFFSTTNRFSARCRLGYVTLSAFGLSLCIESLQLFLRVGVFELTDLAMNTIGAFLGASLSALGRMAFGIDKNKTL